MANLPTAVPTNPTAIGVVSPDVATTIPRVQNPGVVGEAMQQAAGQIGQAGNTLLETHDRLAQAQGISAFLNAKLALDQQAETDPDYTTLPQRYSAGLQQAAKSAAAGITSPVMRAEFQSSLTRIINWGQDGVLRAARAKSVQADQAWLGDTLDQNVNNAIKATDPRDREALLDASHMAISEMARKGSITAVQAETMTKNLAATYAERYANSLPADQRLQFLQGQGAGVQPQSPASEQQIGDAIKQQESGGKDIPNPWQIQPGTWTQYAHPGDDNETVGRRIISDLYTKAAGDPARVAVGYFSGPGNIAPPGSPTPYINDVADKNGKTTSSYVNDVTGRLGVQAPAKTGRSADFIPADKRQEMMRVAQVQSEADAARVNKITQQRSEAAEKSYVSQIISDPTNVNPQMIADDPDLKGTQAWALTRMLKEQLNQEDGKADKTYGPAFYSVFQRIHLPDGDPSKITDPSQLYSMVGGQNGLTVSGYDKAASELQSKRTPDGEADSAMRAAFFANAKQQLSGADPISHIRDPKGEEIYLRFLAQAFPAIDAAKKGGKTAAQIYNPDSPDYVGKLIQGLKRTPGQMAADMLNANAPEAQGEDLESQEGIIKAYRSGALSREEASRRLIDKGFATAAAPPAPISFPTTGGAPVPQ